MGTVNEDAGVMEAIRDLVAATQAVRDSAVSRDFDSLPAAIERREQITSVLKARGGLATVPHAYRDEVVEALLKIRELEAEVMNVFQSEMARWYRDIEDVTAKSRALSAYERLVPKLQRLDIQK